MKKIHKNKYIDSLFKIMLFSALIHNGILVMQFFVKKDLNILNYFRILDLHTFFPALNSFPGTLVGFVVMGGLFVFFLYRR